MPTDTCESPNPHARNFALRGLGWSLALFGLLRLHAVERVALLPLTEGQGWLAASVFGTPALPIQVTLACSGADALALCAGFILAYPAAWRARLWAVAGGIGLILALNTARIGTLGLTRSPAWFEALHVYVWPALLLLAVAGYVFTWMRSAHAPPWSAAAISTTVRPEHASRRPRERTRRFVLLAGAFLLLFAGASPLYLESASVLAMAGFMARAAALTLRFLGVEATAAGNALWTPHGGFRVTQECISTPLIPIYLAAAIVFSRTWALAGIRMLAALPLFIALGIARLLVVALPAALVGSPIVLAHAFYQLLLAGLGVCLAALWRHGTGTTAWRRAALGGVLGAAAAYMLHPLYAHAIASAFPRDVQLHDPQGAVALLPAFQLGFFIALFVGAFAALRWKPFVAGLAVLGLSQAAGFAALGVLQEQAGFTPHVRDVRAWAVTVPLLLIMAVVSHDRPRR